MRPGLPFRLTLRQWIRFRLMCLYWDVREWVHRLLHGKREFRTLCQNNCRCALIGGEKPGEEE